MCHEGGSAFVLSGRFCRMFVAGHLFHLKLRHDIQARKSNNESSLCSYETKKDFFRLFETVSLFHVLNENKLS